MKTGIEIISEERERQKTVKGWSAENDDRYVSGELVDAAGAYVHAAKLISRGEAIESIKRLVGARLIQYPWEEHWWRPSEDNVRNLAKAGALIAAELDRIMRQLEVPELP